MMVQTAFRFPTDLVESLKQRARREHKSVNQYVEEVLTASLRSSDEDRLRAAFEDVKLPDGISEPILNMSHISLDKAELDDRCRYILEK